MIGFLKTTNGSLSLLAIQALQAQADALYISSGTVITGLQPGGSIAIGQANSAILQAAFDGDLGTLDLIIPVNDGAAPIDFHGVEMAGYWATYDHVQVYANTTLTFQGGLMQTVEPLNYLDEGQEVRCLDVSGANVILNNPLLSQGKFYRTGRPGTHAVLGIYGSLNTGNITINGGIIEGGGSNCFQGGRNNTVFNSTIFRDSREHLIYAAGNNGDGTNTGVEADGLTFNNCTMMNPGIEFELGQYGSGGVANDSHEANHIQLRNYRNVTLNNCVASGVCDAPDSQFGLLITNIVGIDIIDCTFSDHKHFFYMGDGSDAVNFLRVDSTAYDLGWVIKSDSASKGAAFTECNFIKPYTIYGNNKFNNVLFDIGRYRMSLRADSTNVFNDTTWDAFDSTSTMVLEALAGSVYSFTGTTTRVCPETGTINWGPVPGTCP